MSNAVIKTSIRQNNTTIDIITHQDPKDLDKLQIIAIDNQHATVIGQPKAYTIPKGATKEVNAIVEHEHKLFHAYKEKEVKTLPYLK